MTIGVPPDAAVQCDWLTLRRVPESPAEGDGFVAGWLGPLCELPGGELCAPTGTVGRRTRPPFGGEHLSLTGSFWRDPWCVPRFEELVAAWVEGAESVSVVRIDWCAELARPWDGDVDAEFAEVVELRERLVEHLEEPRSGWARGEHRNELGSTATLGVMGRDRGEGARSRDPWWRIYTAGARERDRVRVEVERKNFAGRPVVEVVRETGGEVAACLGLPVRLLAHGVLPLKQVRTPLSRLAAQARGLVCSALVREGVDLESDEELRKAFRVIDKACGVSALDSELRWKKWAAGGR